MNKIITTLLVLACAITVTACGDSGDPHQKVIQSQQLVQSNLPIGCTLGYAGRYSYGVDNIGSVLSTPVVFVHCKSADSVTTNAKMQIGKTTVPTTTVTIDGK